MSANEQVNVLNFINGKFVAPQSGKYLDNVCPSTGQVYGKIPDSSAADVDAAVEAASVAFDSWKNTSEHERSAVLYRIADELEKRLDEFAHAESRDQGKPFWFAQKVDISRSIANFRFYAGAILHREDMATELNQRTLSYTLSQPVGVAGLISPWNLPLYLLSWKIAPAVACGNTCVCKPSEFTSVTAWLLGQVINAAKVPPGVINMVFGLGASAGAALVQHPRVPLISFTGGTATGDIIARSCAPTFKKLSLELGGKNPNIVFGDADLEKCIPTSVRSSFSNQGEICLCGSRIFVERSVYQQFVDKFVELTKEVVVGDPSDPKTKNGALISAQHLAKVESYVELAKKEGGRIVVGGSRPQLEAPFDQGFFFLPTVIVDLDVNCRVMQEEIFGPVVTVCPFDDEAQVLQYANGVKYGLSASLWTQNLSRAHRMARDLAAGYVWINCWLVRDLRLPFGGIKHSGVGREGGKFALDFYCEQKTVTIEI